MGEATRSDLQFVELVHLNFRRCRVVRGQSCYSPNSHKIAIQRLRSLRTRTSQLKNHVHLYVKEICTKIFIVSYIESTTEIGVFNRQDFCRTLALWMRALFFPWVLFIYFLKIVIYIDQAHVKNVTIQILNNTFSTEK